MCPPATAGCSARRRGEDQARHAPGRERCIPEDREGRDRRARAGEGRRHRRSRDREGVARGRAVVDRVRRFTTVACYEAGRSRSRCRRTSCCSRKVRRQTARKKSPRSRITLFDAATRIPRARPRALFFDTQSGRASPALDQLVVRGDAVTKATGDDPNVVEMDAMDVDEWDRDRHTPRAHDANLAALVKQSATTDEPTLTTSATTPRAATAKPAGTGAGRATPARVPTSQPVPQRALDGGTHPRRRLGRRGEAAGAAEYVAEHGAHTSAIPIVQPEQAAAVPPRTAALPAMQAVADCHRAREAAGGARSCSRSPMRRPPLRRGYRPPRIDEIRRRSPRRPR